MKTQKRKKSATSKSAIATQSKKRKTSKTKKLPIANCNSLEREFNLLFHFLAVGVRKAFVWEHSSRAFQKTIQPLLQKHKSAISQAKHGHKLLVYRQEDVTAKQVQEFEASGTDNQTMVGEICGYIAPYPDKMSSVADEFMTWVAWTARRIRGRPVTGDDEDKSCNCELHLWTECIRATPGDSVKLAQRLRDLKQPAFEQGYNLELQIGIYNSVSEHCTCADCC